MRANWRTTIGSILMAAALAAGAEAADGERTAAAVFDGEGRLLLPAGYREWVFLGAPLTPNALNGGEAAFPEFHNVYVDPAAYAVYARTGELPDGTVIAKELVLLKPADHADGSSNAVSGRGYFPDAFHGMDVMVKDSRRFAATNDWGFFNFGHHAPPYLERAKPAPAEACAACHIANATRDMMFTTYYPILE
jgi:hypothetical protein